MRVLRREGRRVRGEMAGRGFGGAGLLLAREYVFLTLINGDGKGMCVVGVGWQ